MVALSNLEKETRGRNSWLGLIMFNIYELPIFLFGVQHEQPPDATSSTVLSEA
jgi:hypothetical protein